MKKTFKLLSLLLVICTLFGSCAQGAVNVSDTPKNNVVENVLPSAESSISNTNTNVQVDSPRRAVKV